MVTAFFIILFIVYFVLSWMIIYHLQTYTINKDLAKKAITTFVVVTVIFFAVQFVIFLQVPRGALEATQSVRTDAFSDF